ncbi:hypothetical protein F2Q68_00018262 [Brassica cretica]|uniref:RNase H type-1 domain-containing protein n=1 Tax=Brassica cretica TaxID=69181 RepID=A0A8S9HR26_BRACR|nr:hypothetical protein F2Q68_00018262 [Brassica cretica]
MDSGENIQFIGTRNFTRCESALHSGIEALRWAMENMLQHSPCQSFGTESKELIAMINEPQKWPRFATELEKIETLQICFPDFKIIHVPRDSKEWEEGTLENYIHPGDIPLIRTSDSFSGCGWAWMDNGENIQLMGTRNFTRCESSLHSEIEALRWAMENMLQHSPCQSFGTNCKELIAMINEPQK